MASRALKILLVDDESELVATCVRFLEWLGHSCLSAYDGAQAMVLAAREKPDLVVTDLQLPEHDGFEVTRSVRQWLPQTPVILITAYNTPGMAEAAYRAGASVYLPKPFSLIDLRKAIGSALDGKAE
jgi:CheY-like chemotaxis protein